MSSPPAHCTSSGRLIRANPVIPNMSDICYLKPGWLHRYFLREAPQSSWRCCRATLNILTLEAHVGWHTTIDRNLNSQLQSSLKNRKPMLTVSHHSSRLIQPSALVLFFHRNTLLQQVKIYFVYVCFPMRSREGDHVWTQLQAADPKSQRAEDILLLLNRTVLYLTTNKINNFKIHI